MHITENIFAKIRKFLLAKMLEFHNIRAKRNESRKINELYNFSPSNTTEHALVNFFACLSGLFVSLYVALFVSMYVNMCVYVILDTIQRQRTIKKSESAKTEQKRKEKHKEQHYVLCSTVVAVAVVVAITWRPKLQSIAWAQKPTIHGRVTRTHFCTDTT